MRIFIHRGNRSLGPYSLEDVRRELTNGSLQPNDIATFDGGGDRFTPLSAVPGVAGAASTLPVIQRSQARLGCGGWAVVSVGVLFVVGLVGSLLTKDNDLSTGTDQSAQEKHPMSPHKFGWLMGRELLRDVTEDIGSRGIIGLAQSCRVKNPTVKAYTSVEYNQFMGGMISAYVEWATNGYTVPDTEIRDQTPGATTTAPKSQSLWHTPQPPYPAQARAAHVTGTGVCHVVFDAEGHVASAVMSQSTGSDILDRYTVAFVKANWSAPANSIKDTTFSYHLQ